MVGARVYTYFCLDVSVLVFQLLNLFAGYMQLCSRIWCVGRARGERGEGRKQVGGRWRIVMTQDTC